MKHKIRKILLTLLIGTGSVFALSDGPSMPEFTQFAQFDAKDLVDLSTGNFKYTIPVMTVPGKGGEFPLALGYHSGIKYNQEASWVGLGWSLNAGAINRMVREFADDYYEADIESYIKQTYRGGGFSLGAGYGPFGGTVTIDNTSGGVGVMASFDVVKAFSMYGSESIKNALGNSSIVPSLSLNIGSTTGGEFSLNAKAGFGAKLGEGGSEGTFGLTSTVGTSGINVGAGYSNQFMDLGGSYGSNGLNTNISLGTQKTNIGYSWSGSNTGSFGYSIAGASFSMNSHSSTSGDLQTEQGSFNFTMPLGLAWISMGGYWWESRIQNIAREKANGFLYQAGPPTLLGVNNPQPSDDRFNWEVNDKGYTLERHAEDDYLFSSQDIYTCNGVGISGGFLPYAKTPMLFRDSLDYKFRDDINSEYKKYNKDARFFDTDNETPLNASNNVTFLSPISTDPYKGHYGFSNYEDLFSSAIQFKFMGEPGKNFVQDSINVYKRIKDEYGIGSKRILPIVDPQTFLLIGFDIIDIDGKRYEFRQPLLNTASISYSTSKDEGIDKENYQLMSNFEPYAYTWLITAIKSPDYVDINSDGLSDDDYGFWTKFTYQGISKKDSEPYLYSWRAPYNYNQLTQTGTYTATLGSKEVLFLSRIETATHFADFQLKDRLDARGHDFENLYKIFVGIGPDNKVIKDVDHMGSKYKNQEKDLLNSHKKYLEKIVLYKKDSYTSNDIEIKTVNFTYDYSSCLGVPNADQEAYVNSDFYPKINGVKVKDINDKYLDCGKLTLQSFSTEVKEDANTIISVPPYKFVYQEANPNFNNSKDFDIWGMYSPNGEGNLHVTIQDSATGIHWNLERITTPIGTEIYIDYERDQFFGLTNNRITSFETNLEAGKHKKIDEYNSLDQIAGDPNVIVVFDYNFSKEVQQKLIWKMGKEPNVTEHMDYGLDKFKEVKSVSGTTYLVGKKSQVEATFERFDDVSYFQTFLKGRKLEKVNEKTEIAFHPSGRLKLQDLLRYEKIPPFISDIRAEEVSETPLSKDFTITKVIVPTEHFNFYGGDLRVCEIKTRNMLGAEYRTKYYYNEYREDGKTRSEKSSGRTFSAPNYIKKNVHEYTIDNNRFFDDIKIRYNDTSSYYVLFGNSDTYTKGDDQTDPFFKVYDTHKPESYYTPDPGVCYHTVTVENVDDDNKAISGSYVYRFYSADDKIELNINGENIKKDLVTFNDNELYDYTSIIGRPKSITTYDKYMNIMKVDSSEYMFSEEKPTISSWNEFTDIRQRDYLGLIATSNRSQIDFKEDDISEPNTFKHVINNVYQTGHIIKSQGIEVKVSQLAFDPITGNPVVTYSESEGETPILTVSKPAYTRYDKLEEQNMYQQRLMSYSVVDSNLDKRFSGTDIIKDASLTQWNRYGDHWYKQQEWVWLGKDGEADALSFEFIRDDNSIENYQWLRTSQVTKRNSYGNVIEEYNADSIPGCIIYGQSGSKAVAIINNAELSEVRYCNMEPGSISRDGGKKGESEKSHWYYGEWNENLGASSHSDQKAYSGEFSAYCSIADNQHGPTIEVPVSDLKKDRKYIFSAAVFVKEGDATITIEAIGVDKRHEASKTVTSNGQWEIVEIETDYISQGDIDNGGKFRLWCGSNKSGSSSYIDELRFHPLTSKMSTFSYDYKLGLLKTVCDANSRRRSFQFDALGRLISKYNNKGDLTDSASYGYLRNSPGLSAPDAIFPTNVYDNNYEYKENGDCDITFEWKKCGSENEVNEFQYKLFITKSSIVKRDGVDRGINEVSYESEYFDRNTCEITLNKDQKYKGDNPLGYGVFEWFVVAYAKDGDYTITGDNGTFIIKPYNFFEMFDLAGRYIHKIPHIEIYNAIKHSLPATSIDKFNATYDANGNFTYDETLFGKYISSGKTIKLEVWDKNKGDNNSDFDRYWGYGGTLVGDPNDNGKASHIRKFKFSLYETVHEREWVRYAIKNHILFRSLENKNGRTVHFGQEQKTVVGGLEGFCAMNYGPLTQKKPYNQVHVFCAGLGQHGYKAWTEWKKYGSKVIEDDYLDGGDGFRNIGADVYIYDEEDGDVDDM